MKFRLKLFTCSWIVLVMFFVNAAVFASNKPPKDSETSPETEGESTGNNNPNDGSSDDECPCNNNEPTEPECIYFSVNFGHNLYSPLKQEGSLFFRKMTPSPVIYSPQSLQYSIMLGEKIVNVKTTGLAEGVAREVTIRKQDGFSLIYQFLEGESKGKAIGSNTNYLSILEMTDVSGDPVIENPAFYKRNYSNGAVVTFDATTNEIASSTTSSGVTVTPSDPGLGTEIIRDESNILRQIFSKADGLADIVIIDDYKYEIRFYNHADIGTKDANGYYTVSGTPREFWTIENPEQSDTDITKTRITQTLSSGASYVYDWEYVEASGMWKITSGGGSKITTRTDGSIATLIIKNSADNIVYKEQVKNQDFGFGRRETEIIVDPEGAALTTSNAYYTDSSQIGKYSHQKSHISQNGSWETYDYDAQGRMTVKVMSYKDVAFGAEAGNARAMYFSYTSLDADDLPIENDNRPRTEETKIFGTTVARTFYVYKKNAQNEYITIEERAATPSSAYGDAGNFRITKTYYAPSAGAPAAGMLKTVAKSDGTLKTYTYDLGAFTSSPTPGISSFTPGAGDSFRTTIVNGTVASPAGIANKSTKEVSVNDQFGNNVLNETYVYDGSGYNRIAWNEKVYNDDHKVLASYNSNNTETHATWNCCSKDSETTADGTEYVYSYNLLKQMVSRTKKGHNGTADIVTSYTYDVEGRRLTSTTSAGGLSLGTTATYDIAGRMLTSTDASGLVTTYEYTNGGRTITVTDKGATTVTDKYLCGKVKSVTGTAVIPKYYDYSVDASGNMVTTVYTAVNNGPRYVKTSTDALGRVIKVEQPAFGSGTVVTQNFYNNEGDLIKTTQTGLADTLYEYDDLGNVIRSGLDIDANGSLTLASTDRISDSDTVFANESGTWYQTTTNKTYATDSDATATTTGITKRQLTGLASGVTSSAVSIDINGNQTVSTTSIDRTNKTVTQTTDVPDSTVNAVSVTVNGLLTSSTTSTNLTYSYAYDALGRRISVTDPRTGASTTAYYASATGKIGKVHTVTDAASNTTTFDYSLTTGRRTKVTNALNKDTEYTYNDRGQVVYVTGPATYPLGYVYDSYGAMSQLKTYRTFDPEQPIESLTADTTTWNYDNATGLLTSKTDANGKSVTYTYDSANRLATRSWARLVESNPLVTTYSYSSTTGELTTVDYSDSTPDIAYTYNRLGQQATVTDAVGTRTFAYNSALQPLTETITGLYNKTIERSYSTTGYTGRYTGVNIGTEYDVDYGYDTLGRFSTVTNGSDVYTYNYLANSNLVSSITYPNNISVTNAYEANRDLIDYVENKYNTTTISKYDYANDALGRRTAMEKSGTAFSATDTINYSYNDKSEVTGADAVTDANYNFGFDYDTIGNRQDYTTNESGSAVTSVYTTNSLNQYTNITNPSQSPTYDDDGNMLTMTLASGSWTNTFNAENRIIAQEKSDARLEFAYDYMGRRVEKKVYSGSVGNWTLDEHWKFVYNYNHKIETLDALNSNVVIKKNIWSGETLLSEMHGSTTYYVLADANKNITAYLDSSGVIQAHYEYSPFGKITASSGSMKDGFDYRFSNEVFDSQTGLVYYSYRYYSAELGRWLSRDLLEEEGGINLYCFCLNNPVTFIDILGLKTLVEITMFRIDAEKFMYSVTEKSMRVVANDPNCNKCNIDLLYCPSQYDTLYGIYTQIKTTNYRMVDGVLMHRFSDGSYTLKIVKGYIWKDIIIEAEFMCTTGVVT